VLPPTANVKQDDTHRLIPSRYVGKNEETVLTRLTEDPQDLQKLFRLEGATNGTQDALSTRPWGSGNRTS